VFIGVAAGGEEETLITEDGVALPTLTDVADVVGVEWTVFYA
jgi:hypothetical protein